MSLRTHYTLEEPRVFTIEGHPFDHEVRVALPPSYAESTTRAYPVIWVTDNALESVLAVIGGREQIVVSVGGLPPAGGYPQNGRAYDFYAERDIYPAGPAHEYWRTREATEGIPYVGGGAPRFRDFLIDRLRPSLEAEYRMDPAAHALLGGSAGGWFTVFTMFTRPGSFATYVAGAPAFNWCGGLLWRIEEEYAAVHDDLAADLYLAAGDAEMTADSVLEVVSSMAKMIERLSFRAYPSLNLRYDIIPGGAHGSSLPAILSNAVRRLWPTAD